jgi:hypothetical protein
MKSELTRDAAALSTIVAAGLEGAPKVRSRSSDLRPIVAADFGAEAIAREFAEWMSASRGAYATADEAIQGFRGTRVLTPSAEAACRPIFRRLQLEDRSELDPAIGAPEMRAILEGIEKSGRPAALFRELIAKLSSGELVLSNEGIEATADAMSTAAHAWGGSALRYALMEALKPIYYGNHAVFVAEGRKGERLTYRFEDEVRPDVLDKLDALRSKLDGSIRSYDAVAREMVACVLGAPVAVQREAGPRRTLTPKGGELLADALRRAVVGEQFRDPHSSSYRVDPLLGFAVLEVLARAIERSQLVGGNAEAFEPVRRVIDELTAYVRRESRPLEQKIASIEGRLGPERSLRASFARNLESWLYSVREELSDIGRPRRA